MVSANNVFTLEMIKKTSYIFFITLLLSIPLFIAAQDQEREERQVVEITNRSTVPQTIDGEQYYLHAVLQGQTLYSIARAYGVEEDVILEENPDVRDGLRFDQVIRIPVSEVDAEIIVPEKQSLEEVAPNPDGRYIEHEVLPRETLFGLSREYGTSIERILFYNPEAREGLKIGQMLQIPLPEGDGAEYRTYTVLPGETKYGISREFGLSIEKLEELNPEIKDELRAGQQIRLPLEETGTVREPRDEETDHEPYIFIPRQRRPEARRETDPYCLDPEHKDEYRVALLIPFYLDELASDLAGGDQVNVYDNAELTLDELLEFDIPLDHRSFSFITYYHGVLIALDSIRSAGGNFDLRVYDVPQDIEKARRLTESGELRDADIIIGPFHGHTLSHIAEYGKRENIPVVSPLLEGTEHLDGNPTLFKVTPSLETMLSELAIYISRHYPKQNILVVHNNQPGAARIISEFYDSLQTRVAVSTHYYDSLQLARVNGYHIDGTMVGSRRSDNILLLADATTQGVAGFGAARLPRPVNVREVVYREEGMDGLLSKLRKDRNNIIITLIGGEPFLANYLRRLNEQRHFYHLSVFGIPDWQDYTSIEIDYLQNLRVHYFTPDFYDYSEPHIQNFVYKYREMFLTEPDNDAIKAVQTAYFFLNALHQYGTDFHRCMQYLNMLGHESPFKFSRVTGDGNGWENRHTNIYRIQDYRNVDVMKPAKVTQEETVVEE